MLGLYPTSTRIFLYHCNPHNIEFKNQSKYSDTFSPPSAAYWNQSNFYHVILFNSKVATSPPPPIYFYQKDESASSVNLLSSKVLCPPPPTKHVRSVSHYRSSHSIFSRRILTVAKSTYYLRHARPAACISAAPIHRILWHLILGSFTKICPETPNLVQIEHKCGELHTKT